MNKPLPSVPECCLYSLEPSLYCSMCIRFGQQRLCSMEGYQERLTTGKRGVTEELPKFTNTLRIEAKSSFLW